MRIARRGGNKAKAGICILGLLVLGATAATALAQSNPLYVQFSPGAVKGAFYKPDSGPAPHVGVLIMHRTSNVMNHVATKELPKRGFAVLAMNSRFDNNEAIVEWEDIALDVKSGVEFLRKQPGITKVLLYGGSGGGPTMSFYQAVAEKGPSYCQGPNKLMQCDSKKLAGLPPADGIIFRDSHPGIPVNTMRGLNPAVAGEANPNQINAELDPYNPANGFKENQWSSYPEAFKQKYFKGQAARMNHLIDVAKERMQKMKAGTYTFPDDDVFLIPRAVGGRMMELDLTVHPGTLKPQKLLKNDGTVVTQVVKSVRVVNKTMREENATFNGGALLFTLRSFLTANAIRATDSMDHIDWCSSNNSTPCALQNISVPILLTAMGGHIFIRDNEIHYEMAASKDKDFIVIEGATHGITPCKECETVPGQYGNSVKNFFDYVQKWINGRF